MIDGTQGNLITTDALKRIGQAVRLVETKLKPDAFGPSRRVHDSGAGGGGWQWSIIESVGDSTVGAILATRNAQTGEFTATGESITVSIIAGTTSGVTYTGAAVPPVVADCVPQLIAGQPMRVTNDGTAWWNFDTMFETC